MYLMIAIRLLFCIIDHYLFERLTAHRGPD